MIRIAISFLLVTLVVACLGVSHKEQLNGNYFLSAIDSKSQMELCYKTEEDYVFTIISPKVIAVGQNDNFIIVKQIPVFKNEKLKNYFIIPLMDKADKSYEKNLYGPLTLTDFKRKSSELNIQNLEFTIVF